MWRDAAAGKLASKQNFELSGEELARIADSRDDVKPRVECVFRAFEKMNAAQCDLVAAFRALKAMSPRCDQEAPFWIQVNSIYHKLGDFTEVNSFFYYA